MSYDDIPQAKAILDQSCFELPRSWMAKPSPFAVIPQTTQSKAKRYVSHFSHGRASATGLSEGVEKSLHGSAQNSRLSSSVDAIVDNPCDGDAQDARRADGSTCPAQLPGQRSSPPLGTALLSSPISSPPLESKGGAASPVAPEHTPEYKSDFSTSQQRPAKPPVARTIIPLPHAPLSSSPPPERLLPKSGGVNRPLGTKSIVAFQGSHTPIQNPIKLSQQVVVEENRGDHSTSAQQQLTQQRSRSRRQSQGCGASRRGARDGSPFGRRRSILEARGTDQTVSIPQGTMASGELLPSMNHQTAVNNDIQRAGTALSQVATKQKNTANGRRLNAGLSDTSKDHAKMPALSSPDELVLPSQQQPAAIVPSSTVTSHGGSSQRESFSGTHSCTNSEETGELTMYMNDHYAHATHRLSSDNWDTEQIFSGSKGSISWPKLPPVHHVGVPPNPCRARLRLRLAYICLLLLIYLLSPFMLSAYSLWAPRSISYRFPQPRSSVPNPMIAKDVNLYFTEHVDMENLVKTNSAFEIARARPKMALCELLMTCCGIAASPHDYEFERDFLRLRSPPPSTAVAPAPEDKILCPANAICLSPRKQKLPEEADLVNYLYSIAKQLEPITDLYDALRANLTRYINTTSQLRHDITAIVRYRPWEIITYAQSLYDDYNLLTRSSYYASYNIIHPSLVRLSRPAWTIFKHSRHKLYRLFPIYPPLPRHTLQGFITTLKQEVSSYDWYSSFPARVEHLADPCINAIVSRPPSIGLVPAHVDHWLNDEVLSICRAHGKSRAAGSDCRTDGDGDDDHGNVTLLADTWGLIKRRAERVKKQIDGMPMELGSFQRGR